MIAIPCRSTHVVVLCLVSLASAADNVPHVKLPEPAADFVIAPATGAIVAIYPSRNEAVIYPKLASAGILADAVAITVERRPIAAAFKRFGDKNYFLVACADGNEISVIDADTQKVVKSIPVEIPSPAFISTSENKDDPFVYYCGSSRTRGSEMGRLSLKDFKDYGPIVKGAMFRATEATVSADGKLIYPRNRNSSPSGFSVVSISDREIDGLPELRQIYERHESSEFYVTDPFGQFIVSGPMLYSPDLSKTVRKLSVAPLLVSSTRPIMAAMVDDLLTIVSRNSFRNVAVLKLPMKVKLVTGAQEPPGGKDHRQPRILESAKDASLIVCAGENVCVVPYTALKVQAEPFLVVTADGPSHFNVGQARSVKLNRLDSTTLLKLTKSPEGVALKEGTLTWKPKDDQVGVHTVVVEVSGGEVSSPVELTWTVRRPSVELGMKIQAIAVDESGSIAAVLEKMERFGFPERQVNSRIALVDLKNLKVIATTRLPTGCVTLAIDAHYVYASAANSDAIFALDRKDLSKSQRIFTEGRVAQLLTVADRLLVAKTIRGVTAYHTPDLKELKTEDVGIGIHGGPKARHFRIEAGLPEPVRDGWVYDGYIYDAAMRKLRGVAVAEGFWMLVEDFVTTAQWQGLVGGDGFGTAKNFTWLKEWGLQVQQTSLMRGSQQIAEIRPKGMEAFSFGGTNVALLPKFPAAVWAGASMTADARGTNRLQGDMAFFDITSGQSHLSLPLMNDVLPFGMAFMPDDVRLTVRSNVIVLTIADRLFAIPMPELNKSKFQAPIHAIAPPAIHVLGNSDVKIPLANFTDTGAALDVTMRREERGVDVGKDKQYLMLESKPIISQLTSKLIKSLGEGHGAPQDTKTRTPIEVLDEYLKTASPRFEKIVGRKPAGIPLWLPLEISVKNKELQSLEVSFGVFAEVPEEPVRKEVKATMESKRSKSAVGKVNDQTGALQREQQELKKRLTELEDKLDATNRKLDEVLKLLKKD